jgi:hypothetical protein
MVLLTPPHFLLRLSWANLRPANCSFFLELLKKPLKAKIGELEPSDSNLLSVAANQFRTISAADTGNSGPRRRHPYQVQSVLIFFWMVLLERPTSLSRSLKIFLLSFNKCGGDGGECKNCPFFSGNSGACRRRLYQTQIVLDFPLDGFI